jgi:hypothetical protein
MLTGVGMSDTSGSGAFVITPLESGLRVVRTEQGACETDTTGRVALFSQEISNFATGCSRTGVFTEMQLLPIRPVRCGPSLWVLVEIRVETHDQGVAAHADFVFSSMVKQTACAI